MMLLRDIKLVLPCVLLEFSSVFISCLGRLQSSCVSLACASFKPFSLCALVLNSSARCVVAFRIVSWAGVFRMSVIPNGVNRVSFAAIVKRFVLIQLNKRRVYDLCYVVLLNSLLCLSTGRGTFPLLNKCFQLFTYKLFCGWRTLKRRLKF